MKEIAKPLLIIFLLSGFAIDRAVAEVKPFFTPSKNCEDNLVAFLQSAEKTIDIAIYAITNKKITDAIKTINRKKIRLRILADKLQASHKSSRVMELYDSKIRIRVHSVYRIQHNKYVVIDGKKVMTGSFNFTESASKRNAENCVFISQNPVAVGQYQKNFEKLWSQNLKRTSDAWFKKQKAKNKKKQKQKKQKKIKPSII
ncbi:MAG: phospholipase D-like domain-containing protein [Alphaproteobacteria bacterium]